MEIDFVRIFDLFFLGYLLVYLRRNFSYNSFLDLDLCDRDLEWKLVYEVIVFEERLDIENRMIISRKIGRGIGRKKDIRIWVVGLIIVFYMM